MANSTYYGYSHVGGRWKRKNTAEAFDYEKIKNKKSAALVLSFFRWYPDYFYDLIRSPDAKYKQELVQRVMMRIMTRYRNVYITGGRGITKTYCLVAVKEHKGSFFPGEIIRYRAPNMKQSATLASNAYKDLLREYPLIGEMWEKKNDSADLFRITTPYGSDFTMYAPRGDNCSSVVGEEIGQEGDGGFDHETFEKDILPTCRITRKVHGVKDKVDIQLQHTYIGNACSKQNKAFTVYRAGALQDMQYGEKYKGYAIDISWVSALLCNLRDIEYYQNERQHLTPENWQREMGVRYIGNDDRPLIPDDVLVRSKILRCAEFEHCGDPNAIYIVAHDVSYVDSAKNAKCADAVLKLTEYDDAIHKDKYKAQIVYLDAYPPPKTHYLQAVKLKQLWKRYCLNGGETTYIVIDCQSNGTAVLENLMKPMDDGLPCLSCVQHLMCADIEQPNALPIIYPVKAATRGARDADDQMILYAQAEFSHGNVELLVSNVLDGVEAYKNLHNIKDDYSDGKIALPYRFTDMLCQQLANLTTKASGLTLKEERKSAHIQRDLWSAVKYGLRFKRLLEEELVKKTYKSKSSWSNIIENYPAAIAQQQSMRPALANNRVNRLLAAHKR